jgi:hypothetical protein
MNTDSPYLRHHLPVTFTDSLPDYTYNRNFASNRVGDINLANVGSKLQQ